MVAVSVLAWGICEPVWAQESAHAPEPESAVTQAERLIESGQTAEAKQILASALESPGEHAPAYVRLVQLAIAEEDSAALQTLFARHRAFLFEAPEEFRLRLNVYGLQPLRRRYNEAIQAAMNRNWTEAERGFAMLLGDGAFHVQATAWLFRVAMQQRDFSKARFLAELARHPPEDPGASADVLAACALQHLGQRQPALGHLARELGGRHAYDGPAEARVAVQRAVYLAMIRLHVELDQCFLHGMNSPSEARPLFPDLQDQVLAYLARR
jgi:tetratricopeptide (TPR) repeat protein